MVLELKTGLTEQSMKGLGKRIRLVEKESSLMPTVTYMMVSGKMIKPMDLAYTFTLNPKPNTKVIGKMI